MSSTLWSLVVKLEGDNASLRRMVDDTDRRLAQLERGMGRSSRNMGAGLRQMNRGVGQLTTGIDKLATRAAIAAAGGLAAVITTAASFQTAWAGVRKTVEGSDTELAELNRQFKELSRVVPVSFEELARIGEAGGALGIAREDPVEFTDIIARLSVSTDLTADAAATAFGQLANVLDMTSDDMRRFADSLVALGNDGASTESQIVELAARFGAAGRLAGLTNEEILALSSTVASMGIEVEAGGSSLSRLFNTVTQNIGTASDEAVAFADALGISLAELRTRWDRDANDTFVELLEHVRDLDKFEAMSLLEKLGINNVRDVNAIMLLAAGVEEYARQLRVAEKDSGALGTESEAFFNTTAGKWEILVNNVRLAADTIGSELLPIVNEVMADFVEWLNLPGTQEGLRHFAEGLAGGIRDIVRELGSADFTVLIEGMKGAAAFAKTAFDAFRQLPPWLQQLAVAALVVNKVSGGAMADIAKGLANLIGGALRMIFANNVTVVGRNVLGGGPGGGLGPGGFRTGLFGTLGAAAIGGFAVHQAWEGSPERGAQLRAGEAPIGVNVHNAGVLTQMNRGVLQGQGWLRAQEELLGGVGGAKNVGRPLGKPVGLDAASSDAALLARVKPLEDLATNQVIEHLERTAEMGLAGVGTTFQVGLTSGLDPIGDVATRILARAEDPKAPEVMFEIDGHIKGLEEIQATYLEQGDVHLATKVQANIDTLHALIGTVDQNNAITALQRAEAAAADIAMLNSAAATRARIDAMHATLAAKNFSPIIVGAERATRNQSRPVLFHEGTWDVPATGLAMLQQGEMVIPRFDAQAFREMAGPGGGDNVTVNVNAPMRPVTEYDVAMQLRRIERLRAG